MKTPIRKWFYAITTITAFLVTTVVLYKYSEPQKITYNPSTSFISSIAITPTEEFVPIDPVKDTISKLKVDQKQKIEAKARQDKIDKIESVFAKYNSPMAGYAELIYRRVEDCGSGIADYRVLLAIAGNESGFGRIPYKLYNPYGYLDGKQYNDWNDSLTFLSCVITQRFLVPCENDVECIVNKYAGPSDDKNLWMRNINYFINQF